MLPKIYHSGEDTVRSMKIFFADQLIDFVRESRPMLEFETIIGAIFDYQTCVVTVTCEIIDESSDYTKILEENFSFDEFILDTNIIRERAAAILTGTNPSNITSLTLELYDHTCDFLEDNETLRELFTIIVRGNDIVPLTTSFMESDTLSYIPIHLFYDDDTISNIFVKKITPSGEKE